MIVVYQNSYGYPDRRIVLFQTDALRSSDDESNRRAGQYNCIKFPNFSLDNGISLMINPLCFLSTSPQVRRGSITQRGSRELIDYHRKFSFTAYIHGM